MAMCRLCEYLPYRSYYRRCYAGRLDCLICSRTVAGFQLFFGIAGFALSFTYVSLAVCGFGVLFYGRRP
jgi:hypothetical protein